MEDHDLPRLFLVAPLVFTNLHFVYHYYPYWNGIFLICAFRWGDPSSHRGSLPSGRLPHWRTCGLW
jgi:hypothetical protein